MPSYQKNRIKNQATVNGLRKTQNNPWRIQRSVSAAMKYLRGNSCRHEDGAGKQSKTIVDTKTCDEQWMMPLFVRRNLSKTWWNRTSHDWNEHNLMSHLPTCNVYVDFGFIHLGILETSYCSKLFHIPTFHGILDWRRWTS